MYSAPNEKFFTPTGTTASMSVPITERQIPPIERAFEELQKQIAEVNAIAVELESRLTPILREPEPRNKAGDAPTPDFTRSNLGSSMLRQSQNLEEVATLLASILRRLEV